MKGPKIYSIETILYTIYNDTRQNYFSNQTKSRKMGKTFVNVTQNFVGQCRVQCAILKSNLNDRKFISALIKHSRSSLSLYACMRPRIIRIIHVKRLNKQANDKFFSNVEPKSELKLTAMILAN